MSLSNTRIPGTAGFQKPNYRPVPDELYDRFLPDLSGAELKVLLYIIRRTFGFKRERDTISLSQMLHGIQRRNGTVLDRGVGLNKKTVLAALRSLGARHLIIARRRQSKTKGYQATEYQLNVTSAANGPSGTPPLGRKVESRGVMYEGRKPLGDEGTTVASSV